MAKKNDNNGRYIIIKPRATDEEACDDHVGNSPKVQKLIIKVKQEVEPDGPPMKKVRTDETEI